MLLKCEFFVKDKLKINPRYHQVSLGWRIGPLTWLRSNGGGSKIPYDLEKWKISVFPCLTMSPNYSNRKDITL